LVSAFWFQHFGFSILVSAFWFQHFGFSILVSAFWFQHFGFSIAEIRRSYLTGGTKDFYKK
jgi:hypothetical protein